MAGLTALWVGASWLGCSDETSSTPTTTPTNPTTSNGGSGGTTTTTTTSDTTSSTTTSDTTSSTTTTTGTGGSGGEGGIGGAWPTCDAQPNGVPSKTISEIWTDNPTTETAVWVPNVLITALSWGACSAGHRCHVYLQQEETYVDLAAAEHQAIRLRISSSAAERFTELDMGDRVNIYAYAVRETDNGENELMLVINQMYRGCTAEVGTGTPSPVQNVSLDDLTVSAYENTYGPLFIRVAGVDGNPDQPDEYFALWTHGEPILADAGVDQVVSMGPYCMPSGSFTGLTDGITTSFSYVQGVFDMYVPMVDGGTAPKYKSVSPRLETDYPIQQ